MEEMESIKLFEISRINEFGKETKKLRREKHLHPVVQDRLSEMLKNLYPEGFNVPELYGVTKGRADLVFIIGHKRMQFEIFASKSTVLRDINLLRESHADIQVAILIDETIDESVSDEYFRRVSHDAFPIFRLSQLMIKNEDQFKDELKKLISQKLEVSGELPEKLRTYIIQNDDLELKRIKEVYVKPKTYDVAEQILNKKKLLIITGPPHIGKTATMEFLGIEKKGEHKMHILYLNCPTHESLLELKGVKNSIILLDNAFNGVTHGGDIIKSIIREVKNLTCDNYVVITSTENVFHLVEGEIKQELDIRDYHIGLLEEYYTEDDLKNILLRHLRYFGVLNKHDDGYIKICDKIRSNDKLIEYVTTRLKFPHNIAFLVENYLQDIKNVNTFKKAVKKSKKIEEAVKAWFINLDNEKKYFIFTLALFDGVNNEEVSRKYKKVVEILRGRIPDLSIGDLNGLRNVCYPYITRSDIVKFRHPSYREGVINGILEGYLEYMNLILKELARDQEKVTGALMYLVRLKQDEVLHIPKEWIEDDKKEIRNIGMYVLSFITHFQQNNIDTALSIIKKLMKEKDAPPHLITRSLGHLGKYEPDRALCVLKELVKQKPVGRRDQIPFAILDIYTYHKTKVITILKEWVTDEDTLVQSTAMDSLGFIYYNRDIRDILKDWSISGEIQLQKAVIGAIGYAYDWIFTELGTTSDGDSLYEIKNIFNCVFDSGIKPKEVDESTYSDACILKDLADRGDPEIKKLVNDTVTSLFNHIDHWIQQHEKYSEKQLEEYEKYLEEREKEEAEFYRKEINDFIEGEHPFSGGSDDLPSFLKTYILILHHDANSTDGWLRKKGFMNAVIGAGKFKPEEILSALEKLTKSDEKDVQKIAKSIIKSLK